MTIAPLEESDFYFTPEGFMVFTEQYHLKRGYCCNSGCRHCPWKPDKEDADENPSGNVENEH